MADYKVIAYLTDWFPWKAEDIEGDKLTHINYAFSTIEDGLMVAGPGNKGFERREELKKLKELYPHIEILVSVGGWGADGFSDAALTEESRRIFADSAVKIMNEYEFDGIDVDWEYPCIDDAGIKARPEDKENFTLYLEALRDALDLEGEKDGRYYLLTAAVGAGQYFIDATEMPKVNEYLDFINIMTYDFANGVAPKTGHHTGLYKSDMDDTDSSDQSMDRYQAEGIDPSKLILGVAFYGRSWGEVDDKNFGLGRPGKPAVPVMVDQEAVFLSYENIEEKLVDKNGFTRHWDDVAKAPYLYNGDIFITYDDLESMEHKISYIKESGFGGVMFWEYSADMTGKLLDKLYQGLRNK